VAGAPQPFVLQSFPINPGLEGTFPWLSQLACNYDEYTIKQLIFTFKSTTTESSNTTNGQVGTIIMATNYNAAAPVFSDKVTMLQYAHANSDRITNSIQHGVECDPSKLSGSTGEYVRNNPVVSGQDLKTYDHGRFQIAVANCANTYANVSLGELWVSYTIELRKPKFYSALGLNISKDIFVSSGGETTSLVMGTNILRGQQNSIGCSCVQTAGTITITFPAAYRGNVKMMLAIGKCVTAAGAAANYSSISYSVALSGNVRFVSDLYGDTVVSDAPGYEIVQAATGGILFSVIHIAVDIATSGNNNQFVYTTNVTATSDDRPSQTYLDISEYNAGYSYKATGLGTSDAPVFVNSSGVITIPSN